jgi:hypothetical protein
VRDTLESAGLLSIIGTENVFRSVAHAVESVIAAPHPM